MTEVTSREFDMLRTQVNGLEARVTAFDLGAVSVQLANVASDVAELKDDFKTDRLARTVARRWVVGVMLAGAAAIGGLVTTVVTLLQHAH